MEFRRRRKSNGLEREWDRKGWDGIGGFELGFGGRRIVSSREAHVALQGSPSTITLFLFPKFLRAAKSLPPLHAPFIKCHFAVFGF